MPKIVTEAERDQVREAIYSKTIALIHEKGIKKVTVDDIATAVGISKGAFYAYYPSREAGLYEVLKRSEAGMFSRMEDIMAEGMRSKHQVERLFREVFLAPDSVILHVTPTELEVLLRKLPAGYREREKDKSADFFQRTLTLLKIDKSKMETLALLTDCIGLVASYAEFSDSGKQQALDVLMDATAGYLLGEENT